MAKTTTIQARIDPDVKNNAQNILSKLNMTLSEAISIFLTQVSLTRGIPFDIKIPNDLTSDTLLKSEKGEELSKALSVDELFQELDN